MFSQGHLIWIGISFSLIAGIIAFLRAKRPPMQRVLQVCLLLSLVSETVKVLSVIQIVPIVTPEVTDGVFSYVETGAWAPYMEMDHLPFELCSLQIPFMAAALFTHDALTRKRILALMYPTTLIGGLLGIVLAYIVRSDASALELFGSPHVWQYFLYHSMIVALGIWIGMADDSGVVFSDIASMLVMLVALDALSFYLNSALSTPAYVNDELVGLTHGTNFFSSYINPLGLTLTEKWQWISYLGIRLIIGAVLIVLVFLPLLRKKAPEQFEG